MAIYVGSATSSFLSFSSSDEGIGVGLGTTTTTGRNAGVGTETGTMIYNVNTSQVEVFDGKMDWWINISIGNHRRNKGYNIKIWICCSHLYWSWIITERINLLLQILNTLSLVVAVVVAAGSIRGFWRRRRWWF